MQSPSSTLDMESLNVEEPPPPPPPPEVIKISPEGDLLLVVGPEKVKLLVHSFFLKYVSKPFKMMLGPNWKEGQAFLTQTEPTEILLPEDDPEAMEFICNIIHHRVEDAPRKIQPKTLMNMAIVADKYDCLRIVKFLKRELFDTKTDRVEDSKYLAATAYILSDVDAFHKFTGSMVLNHTGSFLNILTEDIEEIMSLKFYCFLEEARCRAKSKLTKILLNRIPSISCLNSDESCRSMKLQKYIEFTNGVLCPIAASFLSIREIMFTTIIVWNARNDYTYKSQREIEVTQDYRQRGLCGNICSSTDYERQKKTLFNRLESFKLELGLCLNPMSAGDLSNITDFVERF